MARNVTISIVETQQLERFFHYISRVGAPTAVSKNLDAQYHDYCFTGTEQIQGGEQGMPVKHMCL